MQSGHYGTVLGTSVVVGTEPVAVVFTQMRRAPGLGSTWVSLGRKCGSKRVSMEVVMLSETEHQRVNSWAVLY